MLASVPRLQSGDDFGVEAAHAGVIVHGTRFPVEERGADETAVRVFEGVVEVRPKGAGRAARFLHAGQAVVVVSAQLHRRRLAAKLSDAVALGTGKDIEAVASESIAATEPGADASEPVYALGVCAVRRGDSTTAVLHFEEAARTARDLTRADNAMARAAELRSRHHAADGSDAWRSYLKRFPRGLHRQLAETSLARGQPAP